MTNDELEEFQRLCPRLFHMSAEGSWPSIRRHGLLPAARLLDLFRDGQSDEVPTARERRARQVVLQNRRLGRAILRDQGTMTDSSLQRCLLDGLSPAQWYETLNGRVFFWTSEKRLARLLAARSYARQSHDVLVLDTRSLVARYRDAIELCAINSGSTGRSASPRGLETFARIAGYPYAAWRKRRTATERIVELTVPGGVPDIECYVVRVVRMQGERELDVLHPCAEEPDAEDAAPLSAM